VLVVIAVGVGSESVGLDGVRSAADSVGFEGPASADGVERGHIVERAGEWESRCIGFRYPYIDMERYCFSTSDPSFPLWGRDKR
jgi:hypothetical protein